MLSLGRFCAGMLAAGATTLFGALDAAAMNKAELVEAMASSSGLSKADAGAIVDGFSDGVGDFLKKGDRLSLIGFGSFSVSKRAASGERCETEIEVDFEPDASLKKGENPLYEEGNQPGENPLYVGSIVGGGGNGGGGTTVLGGTEGRFTVGDEVVILAAKEGVIHRDIAARGVVSGVIGGDLDGDGWPDLLRTGEGDEIQGLQLRGIEKSDIRRGMVIARVVPIKGGGDCDDDDRDIRPDAALIDYIGKATRLPARIVERGYFTMLDVIRETIVADEAVTLGGFGSFAKETSVVLSSGFDTIDNAPEEKERGRSNKKRTGRNPQTGKEIKIAATGLSDQEERRLAVVAGAMLREPGPDGLPQVRTERKVKFKAGAELSGKVN